MTPIEFMERVEESHALVRALGNLHAEAESDEDFWRLLRVVLNATRTMEWHEHVETANGHYEVRLIYEIRKRYPVVFESASIAAVNARRLVENSSQRDASP